MHLASEVIPLWRKTEEELAEIGVPPPYWAFAWAGGQALARYLLDHPGNRDRQARAGFRRGFRIGGAGGSEGRRASCDRPPTSILSRIAAIARNAAANSVDVETIGEDVIGTADRFDLILVGDMCYERPLGGAVDDVAEESSRAAVLLGDPGRSYFPKSGPDAARPLLRADHARA